MHFDVGDHGRGVPRETAVLREAAAEDLPAAPGPARDATGGRPAARVEDPARVERAFTVTREAVHDRAAKRTVGFARLEPVHRVGGPGGAVPLGDALRVDAADARERAAGHDRVAVAEQGVHGPVRRAARRRRPRGPVPHRESGRTALDREEARDPELVAPPRERADDPEELADRANARAGVDEDLAALRRRIGDRQERPEGAEGPALAVDRHGSDVGCRHVGQRALPRAFANARDRTDVLGTGPPEVARRDEAAARVARERVHAGGEPVETGETVDREARIPRARFDSVEARGRARRGYRAAVRRPAVGHAAVRRCCVRCGAVVTAGGEHERRGERGPEMASKGHALLQEKERRSLA